MRTAHRVRLASILTVGAFALHQLRYLIAFGGAPAARTEGHRYMSDLFRRSRYWSSRPSWRP